MNLEEKQEAFEYRSEADFRVHGEPFSPEEWNKKLLAIGGRCPLGDQRLRIVWGGTAKKRAMLQTETNSVEVMAMKYPGPIPKVRKWIGLTYFDNGKQITVKDSKLVPAGKIAVKEYEYLELGMLRWVLEMKYTAEELIAIGEYPPTEEERKRFGVKGGRRFKPPINPRGDYVYLYPLQTPEGKYWEPTEEWFDGLRKQRQSSENTTAGERDQALNDYLDKLEKEEIAAEQAKKEDQFRIFEDALIEVEKAPKGQVIFS